MSSFISYWVNYYHEATENLIIMGTLIFDMKPRRAGKTELELRDALFRVAALENAINKATNGIVCEILNAPNQSTKEGLREISDTLMGVALNK